MDSSGVTAASLQLDANACKRFVQSFANLPEDSSTLRVFEHRNGVYSVHGLTDVPLAAQLGLDDLRAVAQLHVPSSAAKASPLDTLTFNSRAASELVSSALYSAGKKIELYSVSTDGRARKTYSGSPGNLGDLEHSSLNIKESVTLDPDVQFGIGADDCTVIAVKVNAKQGSKLLGIACWDPNSRNLQMIEFTDDDLFTGLESILVAKNVKEAVFRDGDLTSFDAAKLRDVLEKCGVAMTTRKKSDFSTDHIETDLERLVGSKLSIASFLDMKSACESCAALFQFLGLLTDTLLEGKVNIKTLDTDSFMQLDNAALKALNILPFPGDGGKKASLFGLLNCTKTAMGARLLRRWLSQPLQDIANINGRLSIVGAFLDAESVCSAVRKDHLSRLPDLNMLCNYFTKDSGARATLQHVVRLYQCSVRLPLLVQALSEAHGGELLKTRFSEPLTKLIKELSNFEALVETTIDLDQIDNREFVINPSIDPQLDDLRKKQNKILESMDDEHRAVSAKLSGLKDDALKLELKENLGHVFRISRKAEKALRKIPGLITLETRKDGVRFQSRTLRNLSRDYQELAEQYHERETEMRNKTLEIAGTYVEVFLDIVAIIGELDVLSSFASITFSSRSSYCRPMLTPAGEGLVLKQARHPIVEENMDDVDAFIANDIDLRKGNDVEEGGALLLVTGPNMGGKSTYIRTAGVITLLAHVGAYVPAESAKVPLTDRILCRVGAGDNQHRAISTFMAEMLETASILRSATSKSLVIIDELGRGTGTMDGFGLAYAISSHIATNIRASCLFATHFFELTALAEKISSVKNFHVTAVTNPADNRLTFLYEVRAGACDKSFGVHVAEMAHFPQSVVVAAKRKASELESHGTKAKKQKFDESVLQEGKKIIAKFLEELKSLPLRTDSERASSVCKAKSLRENISSVNNAYVKYLFD